MNKIFLCLIILLCIIFYTNIIINTKSESFAELNDNTNDDTDDGYSFTITQTTELNQLLFDQIKGSDNKDYGCNSVDYSEIGTTTNDCHNECNMLNNCMGYTITNNKCLIHHDNIYKIDKTITGAKCFIPNNFKQYSAKCVSDKSETHDIKDINSCKKKCKENKNCKAFEIVYKDYLPIKCIIHLDNIRYIDYDKPNSVCFKKE